jgi:hypothetical protein
MFKKNANACYYSCTVFCQEKKESSTPEGYDAENVVPQSQASISTTQASQFTKSNHVVIRQKCEWKT